MNPTGPAAQRFPLIARPRPACASLPARITALADLARRAEADDDLTSAARVLNQAALIASDCDQPDLARAWCHRHARAWLRNPHRLDEASARHALEPLVNLARLHIRARDGDTGYQLLTRLFEAIRDRTDTMIETVAVPAAALTNNGHAHQQLTRWLWGVCLADGTRALTTAGHWQEAESHLRQRNGIGNRMLDGRQVAVIARLVTVQYPAAHQLLTHTQPGELWEAAVTACLTAWCRPNGQPLPSTDRDTMTNLYQQLPTTPELLVFHTRLGLSIIEAQYESNTADIAAVERNLVDTALRLRDGHAARDLLHHPLSIRMSPLAQSALTAILEESGLGQPLSPDRHHTLESAVRTAESVITRVRLAS